MHKNVLIVDDEPLAVELLEIYVARMPELKLVGKCGNALEAFAALNKLPVDILLLDINMPEISGMDLLKMLKDPPTVILTTAYSKYAAESYNYNVADYLLKPITFDRFVKAIQKVATTGASSGATEKDGVETIFVRSDSKMIRIDLRELRLVEGYKNYVRLWVGQDKVIVHNTMKNFEEYLSSHTAFIRVHKSFIVNTAFISEVSAAGIKVERELIAVGATYRTEVQAALARFRQL
jgi:DNA-binding LytR/AlgR family response regulator